MRYPSPWDRSLRLSTALAATTLSLVAVALVLVGWSTGGAEAAWVFVPIAALMVAVVLLTRALAPTGFTISSREVRVERRMRPLAIPLSRIRAAGPLRDGAAQGLRLMGSGGLFGFYGRHWNRALGEYRLYATRSGGLVQLDTPEERWVLSPEPPERFLEELLALAPAAARVPAEGPHPRHALRRATWMPLVLLLAAIPLLVGAVLLVSVAWSPVGARVEREQIVIERRWAGPVVIPAATLSGVEILTRDRVGGVRKISGYAGVGHTAWGRFRGARIGEFRLYSWRRGPWVLLDAVDGRVVLTPEDPQAFVAAVRAAMGR